MLRWEKKIPSAKDAEMEDGNDNRKQDNRSGEASSGFQARRLHCEAAAKQADRTLVIKPPDWDVVFHAAGGAGAGGGGGGGGTVADNSE